jgi:hypothetical protein
MTDLSAATDRFRSFRRATAGLAMATGVGAAAALVIGAVHRAWFDTFALTAFAFLVAGGAVIGALLLVNPDDDHDLHFILAPMAVGSVVLWLAWRVSGSVGAAATFTMGIVAVIYGWLGERARHHSADRA